MQKHFWGKVAVVEKGNLRLIRASGEGSKGDFDISCAVPLHSLGSSDCQTLFFSFTEGTVVPLGLVTQCHLLCSLLLCAPLSVVKVDPGESEFCVFNNLKMFLNY